MVVDVGCVCCVAVWYCEELLFLVCACEWCKWWSEVHSDGSSVHVKV